MLIILLPISFFISIVLSIKETQKLSFESIHELSPNQYGRFHVSSEVRYRKGRFRVKDEYLPYSDKPKKLNNDDYDDELKEKEKEREKEKEEKDNDEEIPSFKRFLTNEQIQQQQQLLLQQQNQLQHQMKEKEKRTPESISSTNSDTFSFYSTDSSDIFSFHSPLTSLNSHSSKDSGYKEYRPRSVRRKGRFTITEEGPEPISQILQKPKEEIQKPKKEIPNILVEEIPAEEKEEVPAVEPPVYKHERKGRFLITEQLPTMKHDVKYERKGRFLVTSSI